MDNCLKRIINGSPIGPDVIQRKYFPATKKRIQGINPQLQGVFWDQNCPGTIVDWLITHFHLYVGIFLGFFLLIFLLH